MVKSFVVQKKFEKDILYLGKVPIPPWGETRHFLVVGRPGVGKTTLLNQILEKLRHRNEKCIIHDFKGDYVAKFYDPERDILFNPLDARSVHWCPITEINMYPDVDSIANSLIPEGTRDDKFWVDAARDVFSSILFYLKKVGKETNKDIWEHVTLSEEQMLKLMQEAVAKGVEQAKKALGYLQGFDKGSKVASDVLSTMRQYTNCFQYMTHLRSDFSIKRWIENDNGGFIFITNYANLQATLKPVLSLFIDIFLKHILSLQDDVSRRVFFILDEFATLQRLPSILRALETGRSKGMSVWIALQDISQLQKLYGQETTNTITNTTNTIMSFALNDPASCEYMSKVFGEEEILEVDETMNTKYDSVSMTKRRRKERLLLPSEFTTLRDFELYLKLLDYPITKTKIEFRKYENKNESFILNSIFSMSSIVESSIEQSQEVEE